MTLTELINEVYILTNRPDLTGQTLAAVRSATLRAHLSDFYYKDIKENTIAYDSLAGLQQFEYKALFPRWRSLKYLRKLDISTSPYTPGAFFNILDVTDILDPYKVTKDNICYVAGTTLHARSSVAFQYCSIGYYSNPLIGSTNATFESWIADDFPWSIIYEAAARICKSIGKVAQGNAFKLDAAEQIALVKISSILANGE